MRPAAVLFDFAGTLLVPEPREQWVAAVCPDLTPDEVARYAEQLDRAGRAGGPEPEHLPERWAQDYPGRDLSQELHRAVYEGLLADPTAHDPGLARRLYDRGASARGWVPYPDTLRVLTALRERGVPVAVVSNVGFDLRSVFAGHGLEQLVDVFVESWELGAVKPAPALFEAACAGLGIAPRDGLMVGDNPVADGGAAHLGMPVLVLPYSPAGADHGLDAVLQLLGQVTSSPTSPCDR